MNRIILLNLFHTFAIILLTGTVSAQQVADTSFHFKIKKPAYQAGKGPVILFDEAHNNPVTLKGLYSPFNSLLSHDGYVMQRTHEAVTPVILAKSKIFVSVNAMYDPMNWDLPARSAFSVEEVNYIYEWVKNGGCLFLVTDHMPCAASVNALAGRFGFNILNGGAMRKDKQAEVFSRSRGNLHQSTITNAPGAKIDSIRTWGTTGFIAPKNATVLSSLDESYDVYLPDKASALQDANLNSIPKISGLGLANGASIQIGKGRVVLFADGATFSAQLQGITSNKRGMNHPGAGQNAQFLLNIIHWLDGGLGE